MSRESVEGVNRSYTIGNGLPSWLYEPLCSSEARFSHVTRLSGRFIRQAWVVPRISKHHSSLLGMHDVFLF